MKRLPFRRRLTFWSTLVALFALIICGIVAMVFAYQRELMESDQELAEESQHFLSEMKRHGGEKFNWKKINQEISEWLPLQLPHRYMEIRTGQTLRWRSKNLAPPGFDGVGPGYQTKKVGHESVRVFTNEMEGVTFSIATDMADARELVGAVMWGMLAGLPIALTFAFLGGRALASTAVAPIEQMSAAMAHITAERLSERVPVPTANDEIQRHAKVLNSTLDRLESSYQQALRFSADASHELKTPLTVIRLSVEAILESPNLGEQERIAISSVLEQTRRLTNITASLLLLARADAGRLNLALTQLDLSGLVEACAEDSRIVAEANGITVECNVPERAPAAIDPTRFSQVVSNLLDNAVKYNHPGGTVRVTLQEEATAHGSDWRLTVGNTGPTIPEENQARLFERFFRANPEGDRTGCGLGLGIARELARAHGGDITLVSSRDGWTDFAVFLPKPNAVAVAG